MDTGRRTITFDGQVAWVDEYGDPNLDTSIASVSNCFIIAAVLVERAAVEVLRSQVDAVRQRHFQKGEMKSSAVGKDDRRRERVLNDLSELPFRFYALVVDKEEVRRDGGLAHKRSFLKFLSGRVYSALYRAYPHLSVVADEHGTRDFMDGFGEYVRGRHIPTLFNKTASFEHRSSKGEPLLQLADFLCGSLARLFDTKKRSARPEELVALLRKRAIAVESWPLDYFGQGEDAPVGDGEYDHVIRAYALRTAREFVEKRIESKDEWVLRQVLAAKHLLFQFTMLDEASYVPTGRLQEVLADAKLPVEERLLRSEVVGPLRDAGVLVASSPAGGYKLPRSHEELYQYVRMTAGMIGPMLNRTRIARDAVRRVTQGSLDLLGSPEHEYIRSLLDAFPTPAPDPQLPLEDE